MLKSVPVSHSGRLRRPQYECEICQRDQYAMLVFTNHPHHYAKPDELDPQKHTLSILPLAPVKPVVHTSALDDLRYAVGLYGNVPDEFPPQQ